MRAQRDPEAILAAWLEEGPAMLPESTKRAIGVTTRTTRQSRRPRWMPSWATRGIDMTRFVVATAAVAAIVVGGLVAFRPGTHGGTDAGGSQSPTSALPSSSPVASFEIPIPTLSEGFTSGSYGYSLRIPAGWQSEPGTSTWSPPDWKASNTPPDPFDFLVAPAGMPVLRAASAVLPDGAVADDWINEFITHSPVAGCAPPRNALEPVVIDGQAGRLRGFCGLGALEIEATVVVAGRVYVFTLFLGSDWTAGEANARAWFDAFVSTIQLQPEDARSPSASPSPGRS